MLQAGPGLSETGGKCSPRQKCWPMRENNNTFIWEPMAALQDGMFFGTRKGIFKTFNFLGAFWYRSYYRLILTKTANVEWGYMIMIYHYYL